MSTPQTPPIPQDPEAMTDAQLKDALTQPAAQPPEAPPPATPQQIEIKTETGAVFRGTPEEIIEQLKKSVEHGSSAIREQREQNVELAARLKELERLQKPEPVRQPRTFDNIEYFTTWEKDPYQAQVKALEHLAENNPEVVLRAVARSLGLQTEDQLRDTLQFMDNETRSTSQQRELILFQATHPEIPYNNETADLIVERMKENHVSEDRIIRKEDMEYAALQLVSEGKIKPLQQQAAPPSFQPPAAPPQPQGTSGAPASEIANDDKLYSMPMKDLEQMLRETGVLRH